MSRVFTSRRSAVYRPGQLTMIILMAAFYLVSADARACKVVQQYASSNTSLSFEEELRPDVVLLPFRTEPRVAWTCDVGTRVVLTVAPQAGSGWNYVRDVTIDGVRYPAYGTHATSPLIVFREVGAGMNDPVTPLWLDRVIKVDRRVPASGFVMAQVQVAIVSRGGEMTDQRDTVNTYFSVVADGFPGLPTVSIVNRLQHLIVSRPECRLRMPSSAIALPDVTLADLPTDGSTAATTDFTVEFRCINKAVDVGFTWSDALLPGSTADVLIPTADSDAGGVRLQLLQSSTPIQMGRRWRYGDWTDAMYWEPLNYQARYVRTGPVSSGSIRAQAILTVDYN